jgi:Uma2 family endonuclease
VEVPSTEVQNNFGRYLRLALFEDIIVTKNGKKKAVIKAFREPEEGPITVAEKAEAYDWRISYEDFLKLSEGSERRYEYIDGEVYLLTSPSYEHQAIVMEISNVLYNWFRGKGCRPLTAPFDVTLAKGDVKNVVQPDIVVICDTENTYEGKYTGVPTMVIEVVSESTRQRDLLRKLDLYFYGGVREYWIVNPMRKEVYVYRFQEQDIKEFHVYRETEKAQSTVFEGLEVPLGQVFASVFPDPSKAT